MFFSGTVLPCLLIILYFKELVENSISYPKQIGLLYLSDMLYLTILHLELSRLCEGIVQKRVEGKQHMFADLLLPNDGSYFKKVV